MSKKYSYESESSKDSNTITQEKPNSPQILNYKLIKAISITLTSILNSNKNLENYDEIIEKLRAAMQIKANERCQVAKAEEKSAEEA